jgi:hypothetical protein
MSRSEGRHVHSCGLKVPLVFCPMNSPSANGLQAKSMNISWGGVCFVTSQPARMPRVGRNHEVLRLSTQMTQHLMPATAEVRRIVIGQ